MGKKTIDIDSSAQQMVEDINSNFDEVNIDSSVNTDISATALVGTLNGVFNGVDGVEELSADVSAKDFVDALNVNFEKAQSGGVAREFEDLIKYDSISANTSKLVSVKEGDTIMFLDKNSASPVMPSVIFHIDRYDNNGVLQEAVHASGRYIYVVPSDGKITIGNSVAKMKDYVSNGYICSRSRSRCFTNPKYRWILFGDSISVLTYSTQYKADVKAGYSWIIGESNHDIAVTNRAVSGTSIVSTNGVSQQVGETNFEPFDVCSILIGANDWAYNNRGNEFKASYENVINTILEQKPTIKLFICTIIPRGDRSDSASMCATQNAAIKALGQEYDIPVLDLYTYSGLDFTDPNQYHYTRPDNTTSSGYDMLHPTQEAHAQFLAPLFKIKLMKVLNDYTLFPDLLNHENFENI